MNRGGMSERVDIAVIGGGPAGAATAIRAARAGASVVVFEKGPHGRDKICGDGLTPRAVAALDELKIVLDDAHMIDGLRMMSIDPMHFVVMPKAWGMLFAMPLPG